MSDVNFQQNRPIPKEILEKIMEFERSQKEWKDKYGEIRPPISLDFHGYKMVISGHRVNYSPKWKFFPDFLLDYVPMTLGNEWGRNELTKPFEERHQVVQWKTRFGGHIALSPESPRKAPESSFRKTGIGFGRGYI